MTVPPAALPKAVTYSDTGIALLGGNDLCAVDADGTPINDGSHLTAISAEHADADDGCEPRHRG